MTSLTVLPQEIQHQANPLVNVFNAVIDGITQLAVNARDLHKFLKVGRDFTTWIKGRIEQYLFIENVDFILIPQNGGIKNSAHQTGGTQKRGGDRRSIEYHLTLDMAKELAMVENNEEGRKVRRYFIRCEKDLYKSDSEQREVLRQACEKLATGNMLISDAYILVGEHFGYEGGIKSIPTPLLPNAIAFVYEMIIRLKFNSGELDNHTKTNMKALITHNFLMKAWFDGVKVPLKMLNRQIWSDSDEHFASASYLAKAFNKQFNLGVDERYLVAYKI